MLRSVIDRSDVSEGEFMQSDKKMLKIRISPVDYEVFQKITERQGKTMSESIREYIRESILDFEDDNTPKYVEEIWQNDDNLFESSVLSRNELVDFLIQDFERDTDEERINAAQEYIQNIEFTKIPYPFSIESSLHTTFRLANKDEIYDEYVRRYENKKEVEAMWKDGTIPLFLQGQK